MYKFTRRYKFIMGNEFKESVDISLEKKLCAFGLLGFIFGGLIPLVGFFIFLGGAVAYIIGIFKFSKKLNNGDIFKNFIYSVIIFIIGWILFGILTAISIFPISIAGQSFGGKSAEVMIYVSFLVLWLSIVLSGFFSKKYLDIFYEYTNDDLFKYAGLVVLGGSILFGFYLLLDG
jgi:uncharacterized membrane protein